jgi:hypothetical protein
MKTSPDPLDTANLYPARIENAFLIKRNATMENVSHCQPLFNRLPFP